MGCALTTCSPTSGMMHTCPSGAHGTALSLVAANPRIRCHFATMLHSSAAPQLKHSLTEPEEVKVSCMLSRTMESHGPNQVLERPIGKETQIITLWYLGMA